MSQSSDDAIRVLTDDKTHFPLIEIKDIGSLTLWPITKIQFEMYISQANRYGDTWYDEILMGNPRVSYQKVNKKNYEQLFITGLHIEEVFLFSKWFGEDFRIPTVEEWREIYRLMATQSGLTAPPDMSYPAKKIWGKMTKFSNSPIKFSLMEDGVIDWVISGDNYVGLGVPRPNLLPNTFKPLENIIKPLKIDKRLNYFGLRLIKRVRHG
jgi:hypothetical protein